MIGLDQIKENHPCFGSKRNNGRIHLPVCSKCNIECLFCDRKKSHEEDRPGVTTHLLKPEEAIKMIEKALILCPEIKVAGIAGPGDTLAGSEAIDTFHLIKKHFPKLLKCMSTNGLLLNERAEELIDLGIDTLTVTVNAVDPRIQSKIISGITYHGKRYLGEEAAEILIQNQLIGIKKMAATGTIIKVNTVLITEINQNHIKDIAKRVSGAGAQIYNIIPLIPQSKMLLNKEPGCYEIDMARSEAEAYIEVFRHCKHCRADAVGIPGISDYRDKIYEKNFWQEETFSHG